MELTLEIKEMANHLAAHLDEHDKALLIGLMSKFMPDNIATDEDLRDIARVREEFAKGETNSWDDVEWKTE